MDFFQLFILQFIAHLLADFVFQTDKWVNGRADNGIKSRYFVMHMVIVFILSWLLSFQWLFVWAALIITFIHGFIDVIKMHFTGNNCFSRYLFFVDQILHLFIIALVTWLFIRFFVVKLWFPMPFTTYHFVIVAGFLFCAKPANIIIREIFRLYGIQTQKNDNSPLELPNAGKLIGNVERLLTLTFVILGRFEAVGFLIAAKSILRFGEKDTVKSEYVLIGTLLSFGIAIITGVVIGYFF